MIPTPNQRKAAEEALLGGRHDLVGKMDCPRFNGFKNCTCLDESQVGRVSSLLADREAKARQEGGEKVAKAVECGGVSEEKRLYKADTFKVLEPHRTQFASYVDGLAQMKKELSAAARQALKAL